MSQHSSGEQSHSAAGVVVGSSDQLQKRIFRLEEELVHAQRLATLGTMSAMIAHEFNNLMTPILPRAEFALGTGEVADMRKALDRTTVQVKRAMTVTERLLKMAHAETSPVEPCEVGRAVQEAIETLIRPLEKDGIELSVRVPEDLCVQAHADLFIQVLVNLMLNARAAMKGMCGPMTIAAERDGEFINVEVRDSGKGLPAAEFDDVINPFLAGKEENGQEWQGVGLGLNVCRTITRRHGASLEGRANDGRGCTFRLRWPTA